MAGSKERRRRGGGRIEEALGDDFMLVRAAGISGEKSNCSIKTYLA